MRCLFVTIASNLQGYGHLKRCLTIADYARKKNFSLSFLVFGDNIVSNSGNKKILNFFHMPIELLFNGDKSLEKIFRDVGNYDVVVCDFANHGVFRNVESINVILNIIRRVAKKIMFIST